MRVGLTGGVASGKSAVSAILHQLGAVVIDADALAREVVEPGTPGLAAVAEEFGPEKMAGWESTGVLPIFHYGDNAMAELGWEFMRDVRQYDTATADPRVPTLIYQGSRDDVVSPADVEAWAAGRPNVVLRMVDDGHQLLDHLDAMWSDLVRLVEGH